MQNGNCDSNTKNIYTKFREKIFNASQEIELQKNKQEQKQDNKQDKIY